MTLSNDIFDFDKPVNRLGTWCTQWDYVQDRFGVANLTPFTISDMDFKIAPCIEKALEKRIEHGVLGYSRWKNEEYLGAIRYWFSSQFDTSINSEMIVYGPSVIYIISKLISLWSDEGDSVALHTPAYDAFYKTILGNKRKVQSCPLVKQNNNWECDLNYLESILSKKDVKILLLCNPHNPTGKVWNQKELKAISNLCDKYNVKVISDEIHMDMVWVGKHIPWSQYGKNNWAIVSSASKSFNIPALTGAYGIIQCDDTRDDYLQQLKSCDGLSSPAVLSLVATIAAYQEGLPWLSQLKTYLQANLNFVADELNKAFPHLNCTPPDSTYLAWIDLRSFHLNDEKLQHQLIFKEKVAIMPGSTYGDAGLGFLRLNVGCARSKVEIGVNAIIKSIKDIID